MFDFDEHVSGERFGLRGNWKNSLSHRHPHGCHNCQGDRLVCACTFMHC